MLAERTWVNKSLVVVFPFDPVIPINGQVIFLRYAAANSFKKFRVDFTCTMGIEVSILFSTIARDAPAFSAWSIYLCPSVLSPLNARKISPGFILRESIVIPENSDNFKSGRIVFSAFLK